MQHKVVSTRYYLPDFKRSGATYLFRCQLSKRRAKKKLRGDSERVLMSHSDRCLKTVPGSIMLKTSGLFWHVYVQVISPEYF